MTVNEEGCVIGVRVSQTYTIVFYGDRAVKMGYREVFFFVFIGVKGINVNIIEVF